jgi:thiamine biosynthesis lipoprotein
LSRSAIPSEGEQSPSLECRREEGFWRATFTAMACPCEVLVDTESEAAALRAAAAVAGEARRVEAKFSRYRDDNIVHAINTAGGMPVTVDEETARLLDFAADCHRHSDGLFDVTSGVLRRVWRFDGSDRLPDPAAVRELLKLVGWAKVSWRAPLLSMPAGMQIDFGGIGKEYAVDRAAEFGAAAGDAPVLVNFGGDIRVTAPRGDGRPWRIAIEAVAAGSTPPLVEVRRGAVTTSGDARRFLLKDGRRYGHILDPRSGWPVQDAPRSVTVLEVNCTQAGLLSTLAILQGAGAERFLRKLKVKHWVLR